MDPILQQLSGALIQSMGQIQAPSELNHSVYVFNGYSLKPVPAPKSGQLSALIGIDTQKNALYANTLAFMKGLPANHALLSGAKGCGKSTLVRCMLNEFAPQGLVMIELQAQGLMKLGELTQALAGFDAKVILFADDLSFATEDTEFRALKAKLDGGFDSLTTQTLLYATSNRRHLLPSRMSDNQAFLEGTTAGEVNPQESLDQRLSMAERFGLWLSFQPMDQQLYFEIVTQSLAEFDLPTTDQVKVLAARFAMQRGGRSGRVADQFVRQYAGLELLKR